MKSLLKKTWELKKGALVGGLRGLAEGEKNRLAGYELAAGWSHLQWVWGVIALASTVETLTNFLEKKPPRRAQRGRGGQTFQKGGILPAPQTLPKREGTGRDGVGGEAGAELDGVGDLLELLARHYRRGPGAARGGGDDGERGLGAKGLGLPLRGAEPLSLSLLVIGRGDMSEGRVDPSSYHLWSLDTFPYNPGGGEQH